MHSVVALGCGLLFGLGLIVSGMANPAKVLGFLDVTGAWDPSLAFVMAGAIAVAMPAFALVKLRPRPLLGGPIEAPAAYPIDRRLVGGSLLFGIGWGIAGFCPGPAVVAMAWVGGKALLFVGAMLAGMGLFAWLERLRAPADA